MRKLNYTPEDQWFIDNGYLESHFDRDSGYVITNGTDKLKAVVETVFRKQGNRIVITPDVLMRVIKSNKAKRTKQVTYVKLTAEQKYNNKMEKRRLKALNGNKRIK